MAETPRLRWSSWQPQLNMNWRIVVRTNDLNRYVDSYKEHWQKAIKAVGTLPIGPSCEAVNGWIRALRGFAEKIHDECINILNHGGKITSRENPADVWDRQRVEDAFGKRMSDILRLESQNNEVARKNEIRLD